MEPETIVGSQSFAELAVRAATEAAAEALDFRGTPELVRLGERAVFRLPIGVVARVARPTGRVAAAKEVTVARWLRSEGMDVDEPLPIDQPKIAAGLAVTFWRAIDGDWTVPVDLAGILRELHQLVPPADLDLDMLDPFAGLPSRIEAAALFTKDEQAWLAERIASLRRHVAQLEFGLAPAVIHGDANIGNLLKTPEGRLVLLDLGGVCIGPPEWDLAVTAVYRELGWHSDEQYAAFCRAYGFDVTSWTGYPVYREVRLLRMTCWLAQKAGDDQAVLAEVRSRMADLIDPSRPKAWQPH